MTIWTKRLRAVDFTLGYEVRSVNADPESKPAVIAESQLAAVHIEEQRLVRLVATPSGVPATVAPVAERGLWLGPESMAAHRADLAAFVDQAMRLDDAAVIRLRARSGGLLTAWVATGFDVLASRVVVGKVRPDDLSVGADELARGLSAMDASGYVDPGFPMDSAWRGALPPDSGFTHLDDVPARVMLDLAQRGARLAKEHGSSHGPPVSLLDQEVIRVSSADVSVGRPDAVRVRFDRNGFPAAVTRGDRRRRDRPGPDAAGLVAHRRAVRFGVPTSRRPGAGAALIARLFAMWSTATTTAEPN